MLSDLLPIAGLAAALLVLLAVDLHWFARGRQPTFRESVAWSIGWVGVAMVAALVLWVLEGDDDALLYTTVYLIERSLSLDNLFLFVLLFAYFGVPVERRPRLVFWGIVVALVIRGLAILGGVELIERFHIAIYVLGALLLLLAYRIFRTGGAPIDPADNIVVRYVRKAFPVTDGYEGKRWFLRRDGVLHTTPLFLCLVAIVVTDIVFAIDSIPAAFAITRDPFLIWMGNVFALLGLRSLFLLVEELVRRFRYMDETIAVVLGVVAVKLLIEDLYKPSPEASLAVVLLLFTGGIVLSVIADRRSPATAEPRSPRPEPAGQAPRGGG